LGAQQDADDVVHFVAEALVLKEPPGPGGGVEVLAHMLADPGLSAGPDAVAGKEAGVVDLKQAPVLIGLDAEAEFSLDALGLIRDRCEDVLD
jgi:hypothetical protein